MNKYNTIELIIENKVATVWLNRPDVHNAFNREMLDELAQCFKHLDKLKDVHVIALRGKGKSFSSGADLKWIIDSGNKSYKENYADSKAMARCFKSIYTCSKPTIAVMHGVAIGGGIGFISLCDFSIAATNSYFSLAELRIGLTPSTIMPYILTKMNQHKAKMLMFTGKKISANEAFQLGLVDQLYEVHELDEKLKIIINDILKSSPEAIKESKKLFNYLDNKLFSKKNISKTVKSITKMKMSANSKEGISAFQEKRLPNWVIKD